MKVVVLLSVIFMMMSHPMSMVMMMMMVVFCYSIEMYLYSGTFWYGIVLMIVMLSGVMVIFSYMASMVPNESFDYIFLGILIMLLVEWNALSWLGKGASFNSVELWNMMVMIINQFMVSFLLIVMLMVVWISGWWYGPVRV